MKKILIHKCGNRMVMNNYSKAEWKPLWCLGCNKMINSFDDLKVRPYYTILWTKLVGKYYKLIGKFK